MKVITTDNKGVKRIDFGRDAIPESLTDQISVDFATLIQDAKSPYILCFDKKTKTLYRFDLVSESITASLQNDTLIDIKAMQQDLATGEIYLLQPYRHVIDPYEEAEPEAYDEFDWPDFVFGSDFENPDINGRFFKSSEDDCGDPDEGRSYIRSNDDLDPCAILPDEVNYTGVICHLSPSLKEIASEYSFLTVTKYVNGVDYYVWTYKKFVNDENTAYGFYTLDTFEWLNSPEEPFENPYPDDQGRITMTNLSQRSYNMLVGGGISKIDPLLSSLQHIEIASATGPVLITFPQDMKVDSANRIIWISDTGGNRFLKIDLNRYSQLQEIIPSKLFLPAGIALNDSSGEIFVRHFDKETLLENISAYSNDQQQFVFSTDDEVSLANYFYGLEENAGAALVMDEIGLYELLHNGQVPFLWANVAGANGNSIAVGGVSGSIVAKYDDGLIERYYRNKNFFGSAKYSISSAEINPPVTPYHTNDSFLSFFYSHTKGLSFIRRINVIDPEESFASNVLVPFDHPVAIDTCMLTGYGYIIDNKGNRIRKLDIDQNQILAENELQTSFDLVSVYIKGNRIWLANKQAGLVGFIDKNLNTLVIAYSLGEEIFSIHADFENENRLWIGTKKRLCKYDYLSGTMSCLDLTQDGIHGIALSFYGYVWAFDKNNLYKVNLNGDTVIQTKKGFTNIKAIACVNYLHDWFNEYDLSSGQSIAFDPIRSRLAWTYEDRLYLTSSKNQRGLIVNDLQKEEIYSSTSSSVVPEPESTSGLFLSESSSFWFENSTYLDCTCNSWDIHHQSPTPRSAEITNVEYVNGLGEDNSDHCNLYVRVYPVSNGPIYGISIQVFKDSAYSEKVAGAGRAGSVPHPTARMTFQGSGLSGVVDIAIHSYNGFYTYTKLACRPGFGSSSTQSVTSLSTISYIPLSSQSSETSDVSRSFSTSSSEITTSISESSLSSFSSSSSRTTTSVSSSSASSQSTTSTSSSTVALTSSSSSTVIRSTSSSVSSESSLTSSNSSTGLEFYVLPEGIFISNYAAIGQSYGTQAGELVEHAYAPRTGSYSANTEERHWYDPANAMIRVEYWDTAYIFKKEMEPHTSRTIFVTIGDSGNLHLKDNDFVNLEYDPSLKVNYDYPYWGVKRLWFRFHEADGTNVGEIWLPINNKESGYRYDLTYLNDHSVFEGFGQLNNGSNWIGRCRNVSVTYAFGNLPRHSHVSVFADIHFRGNWLGCAKQTAWLYDAGTVNEETVVKNPFAAGYQAYPLPSNVVETVQELDHGPHEFVIYVS